MDLERRARHKTPARKQGSEQVSKQGNKATKKSLLRASDMRPVWVRAKGHKGEKDMCLKGLSLWGQ